MPDRAVLVTAAVALLLGILPVVAAHGDEHIDMSAHDAAQPQPQPQNDGQPRSYWSLSEHVALMYWHIGLEILAWVVVLPVGKFSHSALERSN